MKSIKLTDEYSIEYDDLRHGLIHWGCGRRCSLVGPVSKICLACEKPTDDKIIMIFKLWKWHNNR